LGYKPSLKGMNSLSLLINQTCDQETGLMAAFFFGSMLIVVQSLSSPETFLDINVPAIFLN
ncbi:hypothetical protein, partial [Vibrio splendidus]|uniref:hypothetical protein n=1 Tax=Vibrio splendidus TaxID=29497 RepID=UPI001A7E04FB